VRVLLTGAGGQLGRELIEVLKDDEVHALDHHDLDITNRDAVFDTIDRLRPSWVINAAAYNDVDRAEDEVELAFAVNGAGPGHLADAAAHIGVDLVHISTDYVFDGKKGTSYNEDDQPDPLSAYGRSKLEGELRVQASQASACILRTAWLYGAHGKNFVKAIQSAIDAGKPLRVVADQVGSPTWTRHLADAINALIRTPTRGLFHVANGGACSRFDQAKLIAEKRVRVEPITTSDAGRRATRPANSSLTSVRWQAAGFKSLPPWDVALMEFLNTQLAAEAP